MYSLADGVPVAATATFTDAEVPLVFEIETLNVAETPAGTVYTVVFVLAAGLDWPKIPFAIIFP